MNFFRRQQAPAHETKPAYEDVDVERTKQMIDSGEVDVIDVREPWEYNMGHIAGARLAPLQAFLAQPQEHLQRDGIVFVCAHANRSRVASQMAAALGYSKIYNMSGGMEAWTNRGLPVET